MEGDQGGCRWGKPEAAHTRLKALFQCGPGGPSPVSKEGQLEREAQSCAMCLRRPSLGFTPPQGWEPGHILSHGTKQGVCAREGWGSKGGGFDGEQAMTSLYPSTDH